MHRVGIDRGMHRDGTDPHLPARPMNPKRDLAAIGDKHFFEHLFEHEQRLTELHRAAVDDEYRGDASIAWSRDLIHDLHRFDDEQDLSLANMVPDLYEGREFGLRREVDRSHHWRLDRGRRLGFERRRLK